MKSAINLFASSWDRLTLDLAEKGFGLWLIRFIVIDLITVSLKHIQECIGTAHEIWMICVYVRVFNLDQLDDHVGSWCQAFVQHLLHHVTDSKLESLESVNFVEVNSADDVSELFIYFVGAFK